MKTGYIIALIAAAAYVIISAVKGVWNPLKWFALDVIVPPAPARVIFEHPWRVNAVSQSPTNTAGATAAHH